MRFRPYSSVSAGSGSSWEGSAAAATGLDIDGSEVTQGADAGGIEFRSGDGQAGVASPVSGAAGTTGGLLRRMRSPLY